MHTPALSTISLHDALPILTPSAPRFITTRGTSTRPLTRPAAPSSNTRPTRWPIFGLARRIAKRRCTPRSEEHTSELQSLRHIVCRLLLEKKKYTELEKSAV